MTYDELKDAWIAALHESGLRIMGPAPIDEALDLRTMDRTCKAVAEPPSTQHAEPFHVTAALEFRWGALQTARTNTTEEDLLQELLGLDRTRRPRTELPWLRIDVTLRASTMWGHEILLPSPELWPRWVRETRSQLDDVESAVPVESAGRGRGDLLPETLVWQSDPELRVLCKPDGTLRLRGIEISTWQAIYLPRKWDDPDRKPDRLPHDQLAAMCRRIATSLDVWMKALHHFAPRIES